MEEDLEQNKIIEEQKKRTIANMRTCHGILERIKSEKKLWLSCVG